MIKFILWVLIIYGITQIIVESVIFERFRNRIHRWWPKLGTLLSCMLCTSVWVSFIVSFLLWSPSESVFLSDIINVPLLTKQMEFQSPNEFEQFISVVAVEVMLIVGRVKFIFFDGMFGSAVVWFIVLIERLITSMITFFNSFKKESHAIMEKQGVQSDGE